MQLPELSREQVTLKFACSHAELGRLLREMKAPLPVRLNGTILFYRDEVDAAIPAVTALLARRRAH